MMGLSCLSCPLLDSLGPLGRTRRVTGVTNPAARRLLLVHAHPDDEAIGTGATMARYAAVGAHVTLVTCTLGEEGEIHVPALAGLARTPLTSSAGTGSPSSPPPAPRSA